MCLQLKILISPELPIAEEGNSSSDGDLAWAKEPSRLVNEDIVVV